MTLRFTYRELPAFCAATSAPVELLFPRHLKLPASRLPHLFLCILIAFMSASCSINFLIWDKKFLEIVELRMNSKGSFDKFLNEMNVWLS